MAKRKTITKPTQAASSRQLDRWQQQVDAALVELSLHEDDALRGRLERLLRSMRKAERR